MKAHILVASAVGILVLCSSIRTVQADPLPSPQASSRTIATSGPGLVPTGTPFIVRTNAVIKTDRASQDTVYDASVAQDILDQSGNVLIPKDSHLELVVLSFSFLGPGGTGSTELGLCAWRIVIRGVSYPIHISEPQKDGGLSGDIHAAEWVGGAGTKSKVLTRGLRIDVPSGALLKVQNENPIRLRSNPR
jgi:hypothetical protein